METRCSYVVRAEELFKDNRGDPVISVRESVKKGFEPEAEK
jgi:hypothetical protein